MDEISKKRLLDRFRTYLDTADDKIAPEEPDGEGSDLYSLFVELAALRNEVRIESRQVKEALDQFRAVFEPLRSGQAALERELERTKAEPRERERAIIKPLLLEMIDVRDRLVAGIKMSPALAPWYGPMFGARKEDDGDYFREGLAMTLRRIDQLLSDRQVVQTPTLGVLFDPKVARAVAVVSDPAHGHGMVVEEVRAGFVWDGDLLRAAEVVVNKLTTDDQGVAS